MRFFPSSATEIQEMLSKIGVRSVDELFEVIPRDVRLQKRLLIPGPMSEQEIEAHADALEGALKPPERHFLGAGAYDHFIPSAVGAMIGRSEFATAYTPYQPEVSQGTLQALFEFQSVMAGLMGTDLANASLYDGASASAEAVMMALRVAKKGRVLVARSVHPEYRQVMRTYAGADRLEEIGWRADGGVDTGVLASRLGPEVAAVVVQSPNFFGVIERLRDLRTLWGAKGPLLVCVVNEPVSLGLIEAPARLGADIVAVEAQGIGVPLSFGGPYVGVLGARAEFMREMPGRLIGASIDKHGKRAFVIALATREQHIRRERATSNICTNQALCALAVTVNLALLGPKGLGELADLNHRVASALRRVTVRGGGAAPAFSGPYFNEFAVRLRRPVARVLEEAEERNIALGLPLGRTYPELEDCLLMCATEKSDPSRFADLAPLFRA